MDEEDRCHICWDHEWTTDNAMLLCDGCNTAAHEDCVNVPVPEGDDPWFCPACSFAIQQEKYKAQKEGRQRTPRPAPAEQWINPRESSRLTKKERKLRDKIECILCLKDKVGIMLPLIGEAKEQEYQKTKTKYDPQHAPPWCHVSCTVFTPEVAENRVHFIS